MTPEKNQLDHQKKNTEPAYQVKDAVQAIVIEESFLTLSLLKFGSQNCETCQETVVCQNSTLQVKNGHENSGDKWDQETRPQLPFWSWCIGLWLCIPSVTWRLIQRSKSVLEGNVRCQGDPVCPVTYGVSGYQSLGQLYDWCKTQLDQRCVSQAIWKSSWKIFVLRPWWASGDTGLCTADVYLWRRQELRVQKEFPHCYSQSCFLSNPGFFHISSLYPRMQSLNQGSWPLMTLGEFLNITGSKLSKGFIGNDPYITNHSKLLDSKNKKSNISHIFPPKFDKHEVYLPTSPP